MQEINVPACIYVQATVEESRSSVNEYIEGLKRVLYLWDTLGAGKDARNKLNLERDRKCYRRTTCYTTNSALGFSQ